MAIGQGVLSETALDVAELDRLGGRIEDRERRRSTEHAEQLADVLAIHRVHGAAGMELSTHSYVALLTESSEHRARTLLSDAQVLERLGALGPMRSGLLTVEQARVVVDVLGVLHDDLGASVWERLADRLVADLAEGIVRPPARLRELLTRWLITIDPDGYAQRRNTAAAADADVELWKRDDGLADLAGRALSAADARACLDRIEQLAHPTGPEDERSAGARRRDVFRDLLLGRVALPFGATTGEVSGCCPPRSAAPCGAQIFVHVPLLTAIGNSAEPAELLGHGAIDRDLLADLLASAPLLRRVWVDPHSGVPIAVDHQAWTPGRDPAALRLALMEMRTGPPPDLEHPIHPDGHRPGVSLPGPSSPISDASGSPPSPRVLTRPHLSDPGGYVVPRRLQQLLRARAPRCEWPGCGRRASRAAGTPCDLDHDLAWPFGPTCACNLGPLCRRHHRIKQEGWVKQRQPDGSVRWTDATGRRWISPSQHLHPQPRPGRRHVAPGVWTLAA